MPSPASSSASSPPVRDATLAELDAATLYRILALRSEVFVVEQDCVYLDQDGRDLEPDARQLWIEQDGAVVATLRLLHDRGDGAGGVGGAGGAGAARIGRVATAASARGQGLAAMLMRRALELAERAGPAGDTGVVLNAQCYLEQWYARFGFVRDGADFLEDGIAHLPMRLARR